jgi:hypothetical protein
MTRERWNETKLLALGSALFALVFSYPLLGHLGTAGLGRDWNLNLEMAWATWDSVTRLHQFPWYQPWVCGGYPIFADPESRILTPFFLLHLILGPVVGLHVEVVAHIAIGFAGAYFLARVLTISPLGAVACAATFMGSSWYYLHMGVGHVWALGYVYAPWIFALFYLSAVTPAAILLALVLYEGSTVYPLPYTVLLLGALAIILAAERRSLRPFIVFAGIVALALILSGPKLISMFRTLGGFARPWPADEVNPPALLVQSLFSRNQNLMRSPPIGSIIPGFWEYGAYISPIFATLAVVGVLSNFRRALPWLILSGLLFITAMGAVGRYSPWVQLHHLPFLYEWRVPSRSLILVSLCLGVLTGFGTDRLANHKLIAIVLLGAAMLDCWLIGPPSLREALGWPPPPGVLTASSFNLDQHDIPCEAIRRGTP